MEYAPVRYKTLSIARAAYVLDRSSREIDDP